MPNFSRWLGVDRYPNYLTNRTEALAAMTWRKIQEKPTVITIFRDGTQLDPQTVRIEDSNYGNFSEVFPGGEVGSQLMTVLGVKDHPSVPDFDLQRGDIFVFDEKEFEVVDTVTTNNGWLQGYGKVVS